MNEQQRLNELAQLGTDVSSRKFLNEKHKQEEKARELARSQSTSVENKRAATIIQTILNWITILMVGMIVASIALIMVLMLITEGDAIRTGLVAVQFDEWKATLISVSMISATFVLSFMAHLVPQDTTERYSPSIRYVIKRLTYLLGLPVQGVRHVWQPELVSKPTTKDSIDRALSWLMIAVMIFSMIGRLSTYLSAPDIAGKPLVEGLITLVTTIDLLGTLGILGVFLMVFALFGALEFLTYFLSNNFIRLTGGLELKESDDYEAIVQNLMDQWYNEKIMILSASQMHSKSLPETESVTPEQPLDL